MALGLVIVAALVGALGVGTAPRLRQERAVNAQAAAAASSPPRVTVAVAHPSPADNERDLPKIPANVRKEMEFIFVHSMDDVIAAAILLDDVQVTAVEAVGESPAEPPTDALLPPSPSFGENMVADAGTAPA